MSNRILTEDKARALLSTTISCGLEELVDQVKDYYGPKEWADDPDIAYIKQAIVKGETIVLIGHDDSMHLFRVHLERL